MAARRIRLNQLTRGRAMDLVRAAPDGHFFLPPLAPTRSLTLNAKMWAMLGDISRQVKWEINGKADYMSPEDWKDTLTAAMANEKRIAKGLRGGMVSLGVRTSEQSSAWLSDFISFMYAEGTDMGVVWSEPIDVPGWVQS